MGGCTPADLGGSPVDLGGSWIHHPDRQPDTPLRSSSTASSVGPATRFRPWPRSTAPPGSGCRLPDIEASLTGVLEGFNEALAGLRTRLGPAASAAAGIEAIWPRPGSRETPSDEPGKHSTQPSKRTQPAPPSDQSLMWLWTQEEYGGDYFGDLPEGGYASVVGALGTGLDVRQDWPAVRVELTGGGVTVTSASGETEAGSHVVVTVPLGVLKNDLPAFVPPLPPERAEVVRRLGFGRYEKVALKFDEPFWREAGWSHLVLFPSETGEPALWVFDLDAFSGVPILVCHTFHSTTGHLANGSTAAARWVTGMIADGAGFAVSRPRGDRRDRMGS